MEKHFVDPRLWPSWTSLIVRDVDCGRGEVSGRRKRREYDGRGGGRLDGGGTMVVVVKLLRKDEISTSWRKTIGEKSERSGTRSRDGWSKEERKENGGIKKGRL